MSHWLSPEALERRARQLNAQRNELNTMIPTPFTRWYRDANLYYKGLTILLYDFAERYLEGAESTDYTVQTTIYEQTLEGRSILSIEGIGNTEVNFTDKHYILRLSLETAEPIAKCGASHPDWSEGKPGVFLAIEIHGLFQVPPSTSSGAYTVLYKVSAFEFEWTSTSPLPYLRRAIQDGIITGTIPTNFAKVANRWFLDRWIIGIL